MISTPARYHPIDVLTAGDRRRFCALPGLPLLETGWPAPETGWPALDPASLERADAHLMLCARDERPAARCSLWWTATPGRGVGLIGHYAAADGESASHLLDLACRRLAERGCTLAVGPMDGSTHRRYRFLTDRGGEPLFFLEPDNPDSWPGHFRRSGFFPLAGYYSTLVEDLRPDPRVPALEKRLAGRDIAIRPIDPARFDDELRGVYRVAAAGFRHNLLYSPIGLDEFAAQYRPLRPILEPDLILIAERHAPDRQPEPVGFVFAVPDMLRPRTGRPLDTVVLKTIAVHPSLRSGSVATLLGLRCQAEAYRLGYRRVIHALMHERNGSLSMSAKVGGRPIRRYTLFARHIGTRP